MVERYYNIEKLSEETHESRWQVWWDQPNSRHAWAFIHYCLRQGDAVAIKGDWSTLNIGIKRRR